MARRHASITLLRVGMVLTHTDTPTPPLPAVTTPSLAPGAAACCCPNPHLCLTSWPVSSHWACTASLATVCCSRRTGRQRSSRLPPCLTGVPSRGPCPTLAHRRCIG